MRSYRRMLKVVIMFKYLFCLLICSYTFIGAFAQETKIPNTIAPFKITLVNGKTYTYQQLAKGKPTVLVYFSPTCDHCKKFTEAMLKRK